MKHTVLITAFLFIFGSNAYSRSSFTANEYYLAEGRWQEFQGKYYFKINEGTGNEEAILFLTNSLHLKDRVKYKLCFKLMSCLNTCSAEAVKNLKMLEPWEEPRVLHMKSNTQYPSVKLQDCKENI